MEGTDGSSRLSVGDARRATSESQRAADSAPWCVWSRSVFEF